MNNRFLKNIFFIPFICLSCTNVSASNKLTEAELSQKIAKNLEVYRTLPSPTKEPPAFAQYAWDKDYQGYSCKLSSAQLLLQILIPFNLVTQLNLSGLGLQSFPKGIIRFKNLLALNLSDNHLDCVPRLISTLTRLEELYLHHNPLTHLPDEIGTLTNLMTLRLAHTELKTLPQSFEQLVNIQDLCLHHTLIDVIPEAISHMSNIEILCLEGTTIRTFPEFLPRLNKLTHIDLSNTPLSQDQQQSRILRRLFLKQVIIKFLNSNKHQIHNT